jgi:hypothetical protein
MAERDNMVPNISTPEGRELGRNMARLCDRELAGKRDDRCGTYAFRAGDHIANGSPGTLMSALKCALEGDPFWCHEHDRPCAGWRAMRSAKDERLTVPWDYVAGRDYEAGDVIQLPDQSGAADG